MRNPFMGSTMSYRVAAAPLPSSNAVRDVTTMAKKKVGASAASSPCRGGLETGAFFVPSADVIDNYRALLQGVRIIVTVECTESKAIGATPSRYCTQKVSQNSLTATLPTA